ncbi:DUF4157 domain-containing protein [Nostoc sp. LEGE 12447]|uniref:eCIS core domain-containing protein n=1 Tax=Nostoc sp. LEGE 12447 TaxID=1828640 RepID=UPI0016885179|nr:DUF4157 domain-containing protein [Nostoc sp. LEGE 12447]MBD2511492.1 DUF4157 domain-containing protein [Desmonostoc muscorum FACHB-395]MBE9001892.1 DUF4157 domain-containing protein [Nostoc sp. LEGE 12447]
MLTQATNQTKTTSSSVLNSDRSGILQRKCNSCGQHTIASSSCGECQKKGPFHQEHIADLSAIEESPLIVSDTLLSGHDFSRIPIQSNQTTLLPKVAINEVGDRFEQEADQVAQKVMSMPTTGTSFPGTNHESSLQRKEVVGDTKQPTRTLVSDQPSVSESEQELSVGGAALPPGLQEFYEMRFGRNFSQVRVHIGDEAIQHNDAVNAHAFTFGNHIWLGRNMRLEPSLVLAHELAHVVQQTQPPAARTQDEETELVEAVVAPRHIQRFSPYFEPFEYNGTKTHAEVLPAMGKESSLFTEAPVPNANVLGADYDKTGYADLYSASTTVGVYFEKSGVPRKLPSKKGTKKNGENFSHLAEAAPNLSNPLLHIVGRVDQAPTEIKVGDLKPSHGTIEALEGTGQVQGYLGGFQLAYKEVNEQLPDSQRLPNGQKWRTLKIKDFLKSGDVRIPPMYQFPGATGQKSQKLIVKHNGKNELPPKPIMGKLFVHPDPKNDGIWNYFWIPDASVPASALPPEIAKLNGDIQKNIIGPLLASPVQKKPKTRNLPATGVIRPGIATVQSKQRMIQRKNGTMDSFDLEQWRTNHTKLTGEEATLEKQPAFKEAEFASQVAKAQDAVKANTGLNLPGASATAKESSKTIDKVKFWTGKSSAIFGPMRQFFGKAFVKVAQFYQKARDKFSNLLRRRSSKSLGGSGMAGAAVRAAFRVIKVVAAYVVRQTAQRLLESLEKGVVQKLKSLIEGEVLEELEAKAKEAEKLKEQIELKVTQEIEDLIENTIGPYQEILDGIHKFLETWSEIATIIRTIEWAIRVAEVAECATVIGCLAVIAQEGAKLALTELVINSCWFQKKIIPLVTKTNYVKQLPTSLAAIIVKNVKTLLPDNLHDVFADINTSGIEATDKDINCEDATEEGESTSSLTEEKAELAEALLDMMDTLGKERFQAFVALIKKYGVATNKPLTAEWIRQSKAAIIKTNVTADEMRWFIDHNQVFGSDIASVEEFLKQVKQSAAAGMVPPPKPPFKNQPKIDVFKAPPFPPAQSDNPPQGKGPFGEGIRF